MGTYNKKPLPIEAVQFTGENSGEIISFCPEARVTPYVEGEGVKILISTLEGEMQASHGDWIIKGIKGEFYPCKPDIFAASYEKAETDHTKPAFHYRVSFDLTSMTEEQKASLSEAESALSEAGISFDTGSDGKVRDWEWDWSVKGPVSIEARRPTPYPPSAGSQPETNIQA